MKRTAHLALAPLLLGLLAAPATPQHARVTSVAPNPSDPGEVWACNRANDSVAVVDTATASVVEIPVGVWPRSVAFTADGARAFVANQRGNVEVTKHFVTPFSGSELRGTISVIDVASRSVVQTLTQVGTEPYGLAVAPNGEWFAVTGFMSGTVKFYDAQAPHSLLLTFQYDRTLNEITGGKTVADVDSNQDFLPDCAEPRAFVVRSDSQRMFVTHSLPGFVSVLDLTLDGGGEPTAAALAAKIDLNTYPFHPIFAPTEVQTLKSQGAPRFLDDIALSPDGSRALVPHLLHNVNHDVNHDFGPALAGDFANRVYPALSVVDASALSFAAPADASNRLHHELSDTLAPAEHVPYGGQGFATAGGILALGGSGSPLLGGTADYVFGGTQPGDMHWLVWSQNAISLPLPFGTLLNDASNAVFAGGPSASLTVPNNPGLDGQSFFFQGVVFDSGGALRGLTNGVETVLGSEGFGLNRMGYRAGHPGRVLFNAAGDRALLVNRGSEDVFLYRVSGSDLELMTVFPPRKDHVERAALDTSTPLGDLPLGAALVPDPATSNDDALLHVINETTRTLSTLRVDFETGVITDELGQISTVTGPDAMTLSERVGQELFEDASRAQTAGNFNNSCASCHFEGLADGNVWQRSNGPRSTMPVYGGSFATGLILWKGVRINLGETGPMFGGENGGTGVLSDAEQQGLVDYHNVIPVPLNPNLDPVTGQYSSTAALGKDLFFGTNDTGMNASLRHAGCASCHPDFDSASGQKRGYTADFLNPMLTSGENLGTLDPSCFSLQANIVAENIRNVNSGVNIDEDGTPGPDPDRNADGINDVETYVPMNADDDGDFMRDDTNSYMCPDPGGGLKVFSRPSSEFSIPTKLGVFSTGPYFHDHSVSSLRVLLDPALQQTDPVYGDPSFPGLNKFLNEFHDIRGDDSVVPNASKVQVTLKTTENGSTVEADRDALLEYIRAL